MRGEIRGSGQIEPLIALVGVGEDRASGRYLIDLRLAGAMNAPSISGSARVENGTYENFASGTILRDIALRASGAQDRLDLSLTAADGEGGRMEGSGTLRLTELGLQRYASLERPVKWHSDSAVEDVSRLLSDRPKPDDP